MNQAIVFWTVWQQLLLQFSTAFTQPGLRRFGAWATALAMCPEEHTITQCLFAIGLLDEWKAFEDFAEYGAWKKSEVTAAVVRLIDEETSRIWYGTYRVFAIDDTKVHRTSKDVWGICTFHEYSARCPNRATTVRAHNWVSCGILLQNLKSPVLFLPVSGELYFRKTQLPKADSDPTKEVPFRTKSEIAVDLAREQVRLCPGPQIAVFDGAYAVNTVLLPLIAPEKGMPRVGFLTRLRLDACLYSPLEPIASKTDSTKKTRGRPRKWGKPMPKPTEAEKWTAPWRKMNIWIYGRNRKVRLKEVCCHWRVTGSDVTVKVVVAKVEGFQKELRLVTSEIDLAGEQMLELFAARFRQEDGFRDLKQKLGWEESRAWTQNSIERTSQMMWVTMSLMRLFQLRLERRNPEVEWWKAPPWYSEKKHPSVQDVERVFRQYCREFQALLAEWMKPAKNIA
jgi:hypothetical protein